MNLPVLSTLETFGEDHPYASLNAALDFDEYLLNTLTTTYAPLLTMAFAPSNPKTIYLGSGGSGLFRSLDEAVTWQPAGFAGQTIEAISVDPTNPNLVWAASSALGGLKFTSNGGASWSDGGLPGVVVYSLKRSPAGALYAGTSNGVYIRTGSSWTQLGLAGKAITALSFHPTRSNIIIAGTTDGAWFTTNSGATWVNSPSELRFHTIQDINFDWSNPAWVYFNTRGHGVLRVYFRWP